MREERIKFITTETGYDDMGFPKEEIVVKYECWANIKNMTNQEFIQAYTNNLKVVVSFRVRKCNFTKELVFNTTKFQLVYKERKFNIIEAIPTTNGLYIDVKASVVC